MGDKTTNINGVLTEHSISVEAFKDTIGETMHNWLEKYGRVKVTVRENHNHDLIDLELQLDYLMLVPGKLWTDTFDYRGKVCGGEMDGQLVEGEFMIMNPRFSTCGVLHPV